MSLEGELRIAKRLLLEKLGSPVTGGETTLYAGEVPAAFPFDVPREFRLPGADVLGAAQLRCRQPHAQRDTVVWEFVALARVSMPESKSVLREALEAQGWVDYDQARGHPFASPTLSRRPFEVENLPPEALTHLTPEQATEWQKTLETSPVAQSFGRGRAALTVSLSPEEAGVELQLTWRGENPFGPPADQRLTLPAFTPPEGCQLFETGGGWSDTSAEIEGSLTGPVGLSALAAHLESELARQGWSPSEASPELPAMRWSDWTLAAEPPQYLRLTVAGLEPGRFSLTLRQGLQPRSEAYVGFSSLSIHNVTLDVTDPKKY